MLPHFVVHPGKSFVALAWLLAAVSVGAAPKLTVTAPVVDFGVTDCGRVVSGKFEVHNEGDTPLELTLKTSTDVTLKHADRVIGPQAQGVIEIEAETARQTLELARFKVTVTSNDPAAKETVLELRGRMNFAVTPQPGYVRIVGARGEIGSLILTLVSTDNVPFRVVGVASKDAPVQVEGGREPAAARQELKVRVPADAKIGSIAGWIDVSTDHPKRQNIRIPVSGFIRPPVNATPPTLDLGSVPANEVLRRTFVVKSNSVKAVAFSPPESDSPALALVHEDDPRRQEMNIRLTFTPGAHRGPFTATIRVRTTHPDVPVLEIPVRANVQ